MSLSFYICVSVVRFLSLSLSLSLSLCALMNHKVDREQVKRAAAALHQWIEKQRGAARGADADDDEGETIYLNVSMKHVHLGGDPVKSVKPKKMYEQCVHCDRKQIGRMCACVTRGTSNLIHPLSRPSMSRRAPSLHPSLHFSLSCVRVRLLNGELNRCRVS